MHVACIVSTVVYGIDIYPSLKNCKIICSDSMRTCFGIMLVYLQRLIDDPALSCFGVVPSQDHKQIDKRLDDTS